LKAAVDLIPAAFLFRMTFAPHHNRWLHRFALLTALATLALIVVGVLSRATAPAWPSRIGEFLRLQYVPVPGFPVDRRDPLRAYHRLVATFVGILVVALTRWLGGSSSRRPLIGIGLTEILGGSRCSNSRPIGKVPAIF